MSDGPVIPPKASAAALAARAAAAARQSGGEPAELTSGRRPSMSVVNFWFDATILFVLLLLGWVSAILQFVFPAPTLADGWRVFGLTYDQLRDVQFGTLCAFALGILVHVMLHWNWVCSVLTSQIFRGAKRPDEGTRTIYGVITLMVILHVLGAGVVLALFFVHQPPPAF